MVWQSIKSEESPEYLILRGFVYEEESLAMWGRGVLKQPCLILHSSSPNSVSSEDSKMKQKSKFFHHLHLKDFKKLNS